MCKGFWFVFIRFLTVWECFLVFKDTFHVLFVYFALLYFGYIKKEEKNMYLFTLVFDSTGLKTRLLCAWPKHILFYTFIVKYLKIYFLSLLLITYTVVINATPWNVFLEKLCSIDATETGQVHIILKLLRTIRVTKYSVIENK